MNLTLLILLPLLTAIAILLLRNAQQVRWIALIGSTAQLALAFVLFYLFNVEKEAGNTAQLFFELQYNWFPNWHISFHVGVDGINPEIFIMNSDGTSLTRLTNTLASEAHPAWSPDGTRIAFSSDQDGNNELYVMNADGSNIVRLTNNRSYDSFPAWSPDGSQLVFVSDGYENGHVAIYLMNADGSNVQLLTDPTFNSWTPCWLVIRTPSPTATQTVTLTPSRNR
ncbi:MAG: hypothetical protein ABI970_15430 [Chloroflexota bacterium]